MYEEYERSVWNTYIEKLERISMHRGNACPIKSQIIPVAITVGIRLSPEKQVRVIASLYHRMSSTYVCVSVYAEACVVYNGIPKSTILHTKNLKNSKKFIQDLISLKNIESSNGLYKMDWSIIFFYFHREKRILCYCNNLLLNRESLT